MRVFMLSDYEKTVLQFIIQFKQVNGFSPTVREIAQGINTKNIKYVHEILGRLEDNGYIKSKEKSPRTIVVKKFIS